MKYKGDRHGNLIEVLPKGVEKRVRLGWTPSPGLSPFKSDGVVFDYDKNGMLLPPCHEDRSQIQVHYSPEGHLR